jgi:hypothetical protein
MAEPVVALSLHGDGTDEAVAISNVVAIAARPTFIRPTSRRCTSRRASRTQAERGAVP